MPTQTANTKLTFGLFEADLSTGELWKAGFRIKLQSQPFKVLTALLERPGQIVTRDELQLRIWGKDTVVDFDHAIGSAINKVRDALGDSAENPRFIETLSKRGYRFIAPVGAVPASLEDATQPGAAAVAQTDPESSISLRAVAAPAPWPTASAVSPAAPVTTGLTAHRHPFLWVLGGALLACAIVIGYLAGSWQKPTVPPHIVQITHSGHIAPGADSMENLASAATDGVHLFAGTIDKGRLGIASVALSGGAVTPLNVPSEVAGPALGDISPDGSNLLLRDHLSPESEQPLWVVPTTGGSALRVGNVLAHDATWMPDGSGILYASGNDLYLTHLNNAQPQLYASLPGRAFWLRWEPNGHLLRFTIIDPLAHTLALWQLTATNRKPHRILAGFNQPSAECCGVWTADGRAFVFKSTRGGNSDLWKLSGEAESGALRLTDGPLQFQSPVAARTGSRIFFLGVDSRSELQRVLPSGELVSDKSFLSNAVRVDFSHDGQWVAWTDSDGVLWRARANGDERLQLTPDGLYTFLARWSPDDSRLALMGRESGKAWQIYVIGANGGDPKPLLPERRNAADPSWSADGQSLAFGSTNDYMGTDNSQRTLHILHLQTGVIEEIPGSAGLFSPRWSPDGKWIAALTLDQRQVKLYDVAAHHWSTLPVPSGADPIWTADSRYLYIHASLDPAQPIDRVSIPDGHVDEVVRLADTRENDAVDFVFGGLTRDNQPLIRTRIYTGNFYSMDLDALK